MIKFSLPAINNASPYEILLMDGDFTFCTDLNIHYSISFTEEMELGGCSSYQIIIRKIEDTHSPHDPKVEATILAIVNEFFRSNLEILLYLCDATDGREASRNRLFMRWFEKNAEPGRFTIKQAHTEIEGQGIYIAIIVENRNPKLKAITDEFEYAAANLTTK